jgi:uncharacterized LabA/DUF88 family protein
MKKKGMYSHQRVGIFVDVQNLYYSAKHIHNKRVNYNGIMERAVNGRRLIRAIAYVVKAGELKEDTFFDALKAIGFEVKSKDLQVYYSGNKKGDWDIGIAMDTIELSNKLDVVVLVSGDGDYTPLVEHLKRRQGCKVEVMAFGKSCSSKLKEAADEFVDMDLDKEDFVM